MLPETQEVDFKEKLIKLERENIQLKSVRENEDRTF